ncbi:MAG TPA: M23 family metallopeptidase [Gammaproteobacteria bacterium]
MSWMVILTQLVLPLLLLAWLALFPAMGWLRGLQLISVSSILLGLALTALWVMPPFWTPYLYALLFVLIMFSQLIKHGFSARKPGRTSTANTMTTLLVAGLGILGVYLSYHALQGRTLPDEQHVDIAPPFAAGHYLVAHGGASEIINVHLKTLDKTNPAYQPWRGQSKALDIFRITPLGLHKQGWQPSDPAQYTTYGTSVVAPCRGNIAMVVDGINDMPVPQMDRKHMAGNYIAIDCGEFYVFLAHLRDGSIKVVSNQQIEIGDPLAEIGNSGNSSEPHLHLHAQRDLPENAPLSGEPLWLTINGQFLQRNSRLHIPRDNAPVNQE